MSKPATLMVNPIAAIAIRTRRPRRKLTAMPMHEITIATFGAVSANPKGMMEPTSIPKTLMVIKANGATMNTTAQSQ